MKYSLNRNSYARDFHLMIEEKFSSEEAAIIWQKANEYSEKMIKEHPNAYGSAVKVSYPFAGIYMALQEYISKEEALAMMKDFAPCIGEKMRKQYMAFTSIPGVPSLIWANFDKIMKSASSEKAGYKSKNYGVKDNKAALDILACPVVDALAEIGMPEVAPVMCAIDQIYSQGYRGIKFRRTKSVAEGDDCCDYRYMRVKRNKQ